MLKRLHAWRVCPRDLQVGDEMTSRRRNSASFRRSQLRRQGGKAESYVFVKIAAGRDSAVAGGKSAGAFASSPSWHIQEPPRANLCSPRLLSKMRSWTVVPWLNFAVNALSEMKVQASQDNQLTSIGNSVTTFSADTESVSASKYPVLSRLVLQIIAGTRKAMGGGGRRAQ